MTAKLNLRCLLNIPACFGVTGDAGDLVYPVSILAGSKIVTFYANQIAAAIFR
jgi:hypothetical protein